MYSMEFCRIFFNFFWQRIDIFWGFLQDFCRFFQKYKILLQDFCRIFFCRIFAGFIALADFHFCSFFAGFFKKISFLGVLLFLTCALQKNCVAFFWFLQVFCRFFQNQLFRGASFYFLFHYDFFFAGFLQVFLIFFYLQVFCRFFFYVVFFAGFLQVFFKKSIF